MTTALLLNCDWMLMGVFRRKSEEEFNSFPHYTAPLSTNGHNHTIHFMALFSKNKDAVPVIMTHGWPGTSCLLIHRSLNRVCVSLLIIQDPSSNLYHSSTILPQPIHPKISQFISYARLLSALVSLPLPHVIRGIPT